MNNNNKKRLFIAAIFLLLLFLLMTFAGGNTEVAVVEFIDGFDDSVIDTQQVEIGEDAKVPEDPKHKNFVFAGWYLFSDHDVKVTDFTNIEEDLKVIALYAGDRNNNGIDDDKDEVYTVTFIDGFNDSVIKTEDVLVGMDAQAPEAPTHRGYTFIGWDKGYTNITVDTEVTAEYNRNEVQVTTYTVTFIDGETNEVITTQNVREGNTATLPTPPVHENRVFVSWEGEYTNVNSNRTITATYTDDKNNNGIEDETEAHYDITYVDYNDEILEVIEDVLVDTLTPTIEDPQRENYEFKGWEPSVSEYVTGNATYKAEYTPINDENNNNVADEEEEHYTIIYNDYDGKLIKKFENVLVDTETPTVENPTREYYTFEKWNPEIAELVKEDATYVASYTINNDVDNDGVPDETENKYTVNYYLISENDQTAYKTFTDLVEGVETPIVEKPTREFYEFVKWNPEVAETVTKDINYVAQWDAKNDEDNDNIADEEEFKIEFIVDNQVVKTEYLLEGEMPTAPTVEDTNEDNRVFAGWDSEIVSATEDKQYIAQFKEDLDNDGYADENQYKVEFVLDGEVLDTQYLNEDELPQVPIVPQEIYPEKKVFDKWTPEIVANYEGQYIGTWTDDLNENGKADKDETKYTITYLNKDGSVFKEFNNQLKGLATPQPENNPTAEGFVFDGWDGVKATIEGNATYESKWLVDSDKDGIADENEHEIKFIVDGKVVKTEYLSDNEMPTAPTVTDTNQDNRVFVKWNPEIVAATENAQYTAEFAEDLNNNGEADKEETKYTIKYLNKDGSVFKEFNNQLKGLTTPQPENKPVAEGFVFDGWDGVKPTIEGNATYESKWLVDSDKDGIADEDEFKIEFIVDREVVKTEYLTEGQNPTAPTVTDTNQDNRVFVKWNPEIVAATENAQYTAEFAEDLNNNGEADKEETKYTIKYLNKDGSVFKEFNNQLKGLITPQPENKPVAEGFVFDGWDGVKAIIEGNATYESKWLVDSDKDGIADEKEVKVEFYVDNKVEKTEYLMPGEKPTAPEVEDTDKDNRVFTGWTPEITEVKEEDKTVKYEATFAEDLNNNGKADKDETKFTITYLNKDGSVFKEFNNQLEGLATPQPENNPTAEGFVFDGWDGVKPTIEGNATYESKWLVDSDKDGIADEDEFKIEFIVDREVVKTEYLTEGQNPTAPTVTDTNEDNRVFVKWNPEIVAATENAQYTAEFAEDLNNNGEADKEETKYTIKYLNKDGSVFKEFNNQLKGLTTPQPENNPTVEGFVFDGWDGVKATIEGNATYESKWLVDSDKDGIADENEHEIKFIVDGKVVKTEYLSDNEMPTAPSMDEYDTEDDERVFANWKPEVVAATADAEYVAQFKDDVNNDGKADEDQFLIEFYNKDEFVSSDYYNEGETVVAPTLEDSKNDGETHTGWDPEFNSTASASVRYDAVWETDIDNDNIADESEHEIKFIVDGKVVKTEYLSDNEMPTAPSMDEYDTEDDERVFANWKPEVVAATADAEYVAQFKDDVNNDGTADEDQFLIEFYSKDEFVSSDYYNEGETVVAPTLIDTDKDGEVHTGWNPEFNSTATASVRYDAVWDKDIDNDGVADKEQLLVQFVANNQTILSDYVTKGEPTPMPNPNAIPTVAGKAFYGWNPTVSEKVEVAVTYEALYGDDTDNDGKADITEIKIEFNINNELFETQYLQLNEMPVAPTPTKKGYILSAWTPEIEKVTGPQVYNATWLVDSNEDGTADEDQFLIEFYNKDEFVSSDYYNEGETVVAPTLTDTKEDGETHTGWDPEFNSTATASVRYDAVWETDIDNDNIADESEHEIKFIVDGKVVKTEYLSDNEMPTAPSMDEYDTEDDERVFANWKPEVVAATADAEYVAQFKDDVNNDGTADEDQFLIEFYSKDEFVSSNYYNEGQTVVAPTLTDTKEDGETHTGWTPEFNPTATASVRYDAVWETDTDNDNVADEDEFTIEFIVDGQVVDTQYLIKDEMPVSPNMEQYDTNSDSRVFAEWNPTLAPATADQQYEAVFTADINNDGIADSEQTLWTVKFYGNDNTTVISEQIVVDGESATAPTAPTKTGYTFKNWDKEYSNVTSNLDVYPVFADETAPEVSLSSELQTENTEAKVTVNATDLGSGVKTIKYALGSKEVADFADVNAIDSTNFVVNVNGVYTVYVEDNAGNVTLKEIEITGIELAPSDEGKTEFKDEYVTITMSKLEGLWLPLIGTIKDYNLDFTLTADPETGAKIKEVRYHQGDFMNWNNNYVSESHFESGCSRDKKVYDETDGAPLDKITINLTTPYPDRFTIYVVYELDGEEYTRLYKVRLAQFLNP